MNAEKKQSNVKCITENAYTNTTQGDVFDRNDFEYTINTVKDSFIKIVSDPNILEHFIESMGLEDIIDQAVEENEND